MTDEPLISPIPNLNGTSRRELIEQHIAAADALEAAIEAIATAAPNGRDFPGRRDLFDMARYQHERRVRAVQQARDDILAIAEAINEKPGGR